MKLFFLLLAGLLLALPAGCAVRAGHARSLASFRSAAKRFGDRLDLPRFEATATELDRSVRRTLARADGGLDRLAAQDPEGATFESTIAELDDVLYPVVNLANKVYLMKETQVEEGMRKAATSQVEAINEWLVGVQYREDVYRACKAFEEAYRAGRRPALSGEPLKLLEDTMRDYRRAGMELDPQTRARVEELQNELNRLSNQFDTHITDAQVEILFTGAELEGVPASFLEASGTGDDRHSVRPTVVTDYLAVMQNARREDTRKRLKVARYGIAMDANLPILKDLVRVRDEIARTLGYASWDDYQIEPRMAKTGARALAFAADLAARLEPKFRAELEEYRTMKAADTGDPDAEIAIWDFRYYQNQLLKRKYRIDTEALRVFFELDRVLEGMFSVFEDIFGLEIVPVHAPNAWHSDVTLYAVSDAASGEPLGLLYFDPFPREGKYNHFAQFGVIDGKRLEDGSYQRPVVALVCNFTPPAGGKPSLLAHEEVETLFHEFGHALHTILTRTAYVKFSGTNVPTDFVEAPSQMLENWVWDPAVLDRFAADYRNPTQKIDPAILARMKEAELATQGVHYRRQLCFALADLRMHAAGADKDPGRIANETMAEVFLPPPEGTAFAAYWGHLTGYDAGYYGYAWADSIAADLATAFENAPGRFLDRETGMRLRNEIYAVGGSREVDESIRRFLGRDPTSDAFLKTLGIR